MPIDDFEPETRYAKSGGLHIAYQTAGEGPIDLVIVPGFTWHIEYQWEDARFASVARKLGTFARVIWLDKRGTGLSDRVPNDELPSLEERIDDLRAVMDAAGCERAALLGFWEGGPICTLFAATYPERTRSLILFGTPVAFTRKDDYPWAADEEANRQMTENLGSYWGQGNMFAALAPSLAGDPRAMRWFARMERNAASPGAVATLWRMNMDIDVRAILPAIRVPTLVMNRTNDPLVPIEAARYLAERVPGARFVELAGRDHLFWVGDADAFVAEVREFLTGVREEVDVDRVLATVLFVDIVDSTKHAAELGDRRWRDLLATFYEEARQELGRYRGTEVKTTGDGLLARFDGPARGIRAAAAIRAAAKALGLDVRAGLHTGECELLGDDVGGIAVHIAARVMDSAAAGEVRVSGTVKDLVAGSGLTFVDCGRHVLKGVPGEWAIHSVQLAA
jgi:pimeloyl-ACP methyl ester carboxylesterase